MLLRRLKDRDRLVQLSDVPEHGSAVKQRYTQLQHALAVTPTAPRRQPGTLPPDLNSLSHHGLIDFTLRLQQQRLALPLEETDLLIASAEVLLVGIKEVQCTVDSAVRSVRSVRLRLLDQRISKVDHGVGDTLRVADSQGTVEHPGGAFGQLRKLCLFCRPPLIHPVTL